MYTYYEIRSNNVECPIESEVHPFDAIVRCAELRFAGYKAIAYEVTVDVNSATVERVVLY